MAKLKAFRSGATRSTPLKGGFYMAMVAMVKADLVSLKSEVKTGDFSITEGAKIADVFFV